MTWIIYASLSAVFAAAVAIFGKMGLSQVDSTLATAVRSVIMALFLSAVALSLGKFAFVKSIDGKALTYIALSGIAGALSWLFYFIALKTGPVSGVAAIDRSSVVFVVLLAALFLGEGLTLKVLAGAVLILAGAVLMVLK